MRDKFAHVVRFSHREMLDRGEPVPYAKIIALAKLASKLSRGELCGQCLHCWWCCSVGALR